MCFSGKTVGCGRGRRRIDKKRSCPWVYASTMARRCICTRAEKADQKYSCTVKPLNSGHPRSLKLFPLFKGCRYSKGPRVESHKGKMCKTRTRCATYNLVMILFLNVHIFISNLIQYIMKVIKKR